MERYRAGPVIAFFWTSRFRKSIMRIFLVLFLHIFSLGVAHSAQDFSRAQAVCAELFSGDLQPSAQELVVPSDNITQAVGRPGGLVFMDKKAYSEAAEAESIRPDSILVLDEIDPQIDLPLVAGVILGRPLPLKGTHIEISADKLRIPLVVADLGLHRSDLKSLEEHVVVLDSSAPGKFSLRESGPFDSWPPRRAQIPRPLQLKNRMTPQQRFQSYVATPKRDQVFRLTGLGEDWEMDLLGSKYTPLADLVRQGNRNAQDVAALTALFYEDFMAQFEYQGISLADHIQSLNRSEASMSEQDLRSKLQFVREAILKSTPSGPWGKQMMDSVYEVLKNEFPTGDNKAPTPWIVRSNNDFEDLITQGLFASHRVKTDSVAGLLATIQSVFASMYTYRSFVIRRSQGLPEAHLRMPLLVHRFAPVEPYSGTVTFRLNGAGQVEADVQAVNGAHETATNPSSDADTLSGLFTSDGVSMGMRWNISQGSMPAQLVAQMQTYFKGLNKNLIRDLTAKKYIAEKVETEFVVSTEGVINVQYKTRMGSEIVGDILTGKLNYGDLQATQSQAFDMFKSFDLKPLNQMSLDRLEAPEGARRGHRFLLLIDGAGQKHVALWRDSRHHDQVIMKIQSQNSDLFVKAKGFMSINVTRQGLQFVVQNDSYMKDQAHVVEMARVIEYVLYNHAPPELISDLIYRGAKFRMVYSLKSRDFEVSLKPSDGGER